MAVAITRTANPAGVGAVSSATTYSAASTGTASNDRVIVVAIGKEVVTVVVNSVTINDGSGAVTMTLIDGNTFGSMGAWLYFTSLPTGTTADIIVNWSGGLGSTENHIAVYALTGAAFPPVSNGNNTSTDMDSTAPLTTGSVTIATSGGMLAVAVGATDTVAKTWANITADVEEDAGAFRITTATRTTAATVTATCTGTTNGEDGVLAWAIFRASAIPEMTLQPYRMCR